MTGTAREVAGELWSVYGLRVIGVPLHRPLHRVYHPTRVVARREDKWQAVLERVRELHAEGRAVLIGACSVAASEQIGERLAAAGLAPRVLNARQDRTEAEIVAEAGRPGRVTVATNMAGRGTDIVLDPEVRQAGGLHVILTERHEAARIDRQLEGRCARQGDPGSFEALLSLEDHLVAGRRGGPLARLARSPLAWRLGIGEALGRLAIARAQRRLERLHARVRATLLRHDERQRDMLAFSGRE